jgi:hypothetical protein
MFFGYLWQALDGLKRLSTGGSMILETKSLVGGGSSHLMRILRHSFRGILAVKPVNVPPMHSRKFVICTDYHKDERYLLRPEFEMALVNAQNTLVRSETSAFSAAIRMAKEIRRHFPHANRSILNSISDAMQRTRIETS